MVKYCNKCGVENIDDAKYCSKCGNIINDYIKTNEKEKKTTENQTNSKRINYKKILLISIFTLLLLWGVVYLFLWNQMPKAISGDYTIEFNPNVNNYFRITLDGTDYDLNPKYSNFSHRSILYTNIEEPRYIKLSVCNKPSEFGESIIKCDILNYKIIESNKNLYLEEVSCNDCKKELNVVKSLIWTSK